MRKLLLFAMGSIVSLAAFSQGPVTKTWEIKATETAGALMSTAASQNTTIAYNKLTEKLYLADRNNKISILNASDGTLASPSTLTTLLSSAHVGWGASYKYTKIRVTSTGEIYSCNMTLGAGTAYIYRWASETDANPTVSAISVSLRTGDSFAVSGTGVNTIIYLSGAGNDKVYVCKTADGVTFTLDHTITLSAASDARSSISPVTNSLTSDLWINTLNVTLKRITSNATGAITATSAIPSGTINQIYANAEYFEDGSTKYLGVTGANDATLGLNMKVYDITNLAAITEVASGIIAPTSYASNPNAYGDFAFRKNSAGNYTFFHLQGSNAVAAYTTASVTPVTLTSFTAAVKNSTNTLNWITGSEANNAGFDIESATNGVDFKKIAFVATKAIGGNSNAVLNYSFQDNFAASGTTYYRLKQVDFNGDFKYSDVKVINNKLQNTAGFSVYPNPATNYVDIDGADAAGVKVQLFATTGTEIETSKLLQGKRLDMSGLNTGVYVLRISQNGILVKSIKLIKN